MRALAVISSVSAVLACTQLGCGDDGGGTCGPGSASAMGLTATGSGIAFTYSGLTEGPNGDCPPVGGSDIVSVTVSTPVSDFTQIVAFCIPRPNELGSDLALGSDVNANEPPAALVNLSGSADGCIYNYDPTVAITGTLHATGVCGNGAGSAGFALTVDATVAMAGSGSSSCPATDVTVQLAGTIAVLGAD